MVVSGKFCSAACDGRHIWWADAQPHLSCPGQAVAKVQQYLERGSAELHYVRKMFEAGAFRLEPPQNVAAMAADICKWGEFGMIPSLNARRIPTARRSSTKTAS